MRLLARSIGAMFPPSPVFGEIVIRTRFLDYPGRFVYHCHVLPHEDRGMMGVVEVIEKESEAD